MDVGGVIRYPLGRSSITPCPQKKLNFYAVTQVFGRDRRRALKPRASGRWPRPPARNWRSGGPLSGMAAGFLWQLLRHAGPSAAPAVACAVDAESLGPRDGCERVASRRSPGVPAMMQRKLSTPMRYRTP